MEKTDNGQTMASENSSRSYYNTTPLTSGNDQRIFFVEESDIIVLICINTFLCLGIIGNIHSFFVYLFKFNHSVLRLFIVCLSFADFLTCVFEIPYYTLWYTNIFNSEEVCKALVFFTFAPSGYSLVVLAFIAIDRYRRVCKPLKKQISIFMVRLGLGIIALYMCILHSFGAALHGVQIVYTKEVTSQAAGHRCGINDPQHGSSVVYVTLSVFNSFVSFILCGITYFLICKRLLERKRRKKARREGHFREERHVCQEPKKTVWHVEGFKSDDTNSEKNDTSFTTGQYKQEESAKMAKKKRKASTKFQVIKRTMMFATASHVSYIGFFVFVITAAIRVPTLNDQLNGFINILGRMYIINHVVNPYIYAIMDGKFRSSCKMIYKYLWNKVAEVHVSCKKA